MPTPDPTLVTTAFVSSGISFNAIWPYATPFLSIAAPFVLLSLAIGIAMRMLFGIKVLV